jgi:hypothetical protein
MSNNLWHLQLRATLDDSIFSSVNNPALFWPKLEISEVTFHIVRPDGKWYFQGSKGQGHEVIGFTVAESSYPPFDKSEDDRESHYSEPRDNRHNQFRTSAHKANLKPFLEGLVKTVGLLPSLKKALVWSPLRWLNTEDISDFHQYDTIKADDLAWGIVYSEPGCFPLKRFDRYCESYPSGTCPSCLLIWLVDRWWRLDSEL